MGEISVITRETADRVVGVRRLRRRRLINRLCAQKARLGAFGLTRQLPSVCEQCQCVGEAFECDFDLLALDTHLGGRSNPFLEGITELIRNRQICERQADATKGFGLVFLERLGETPVEVGKQGFVPLLDARWNHHQVERAMVPQRKYLW